MTDVTAAIREHGLRWCVNPQRFNVAGIIWTYQCTIACRHCLFACRPERPHVVMRQEHCLSYLRAFHRFPRVIHLAGGECTIFYDEMLELCRAAQREGVSPHFIESNSSWCVDDAIAERRFGELRDAGILGVLLSCDPYHQCGGAIASRPISSARRTSSGARPMPRATPSSSTWPRTTRRCATTPGGIPRSG